MPYAKHVKGGAVGYTDGGKSITIQPGAIANVPQRILDKYKRQGRFKLVATPEALPLDMRVQNTALQRGDVDTRGAGGSPASVGSQQVSQGKYLHRHRGGGKWAVTDTANGEVVQENGVPLEGMTKEEAIAKTNVLNGTAGASS